MSHRLREAMKAGTLPPMGCEGAIVEVDEAFIGRRPNALVSEGIGHKLMLRTLAERGNGAVIDAQAEPTTKLWLYKQRVAKAA